MKRSIRLLFILLFALAILCSCTLPLPKEDGDSPENGGGGTQTFFTVSFDTAGGSSLKPREVEKNGKIPEPPYPPAKKGYIFDSWYFGNKKWNFARDAVTEDITLTASYKTIDYKISYELFGGEAEEPLAEFYNIESGIIRLPEIVRGSSHFMGWFLNGEKITEITDNMRGDITLMAKFYDTVPEIIETDNSSAKLSAYTETLEGSVAVELVSEEKEITTATLRAELPESWHIVKAVQGGRIRYLTALCKDNKKYAEFEMLSDTSRLVLTPVTLTDDLILESEFGTLLSNGHRVDTNYFPGFVRKTVTFTLDDGLVYDEMLLDILKPAGIRGTFNICNTDRLRADEYKALYEGYEVANHHILHTTAMREGFDYSNVVFSDNYLPAESERNNGIIYKNGLKVDGETVDGFYYVHYTLYGSNAGWHPLATDEAYMKYLSLTEDKIEAVFGEGAVVGFAYPHGSLNEELKRLIKECGYLYARKTGNLKGTTGFSLPADRFAWTYNADHNCLGEVMAEFDKYADDGKLKMFAFGVHAKDFETYGKWDELRAFANNYGNRQDEFWYSTNREIFEYEDALSSLVITDEKISNPSKVDLFITVDGIKTLIEAGSEYLFN